MSKNIDSTIFLNTIREGLVGYDPTILIAQLIKFVLKNRYEGLILIDTEARIVFMDRPSEKSFGLQPGGAKGILFKEFFPDSDLPEVGKSGIPQIGQIQEVRGTKKIVSRFPLFHDGELVGAIGKVVFHELEEIENLSHTIKNLQKKISIYKMDFLATNKAHYSFDDILGMSQSIIRTKERAKRLASTDCTILLSGESGTGKELFAHSIHQSSPRRTGPFVKVNCAAIPFDLAESELFGYDKGAFTGSNPTGKKGKFELASGGTIFLDEISSMPLAIQAMVLRAIQEKEVQPLGSSGTKKVDFRLIAATHEDLEEYVKRKRFRGDLYYRLSAVPCFIRPLRERPEDIPFLTNSLLKDINKKLNAKVTSISPDALKILTEYHWHGNVRELINILEQSILNVYTGDQITVKSLPEVLKKSHMDSIGHLKGIRQVVAEAEKEAIKTALERTKGNRKRAAKMLGISRAALYNKLNRFKIDELEN